MKSNSMQARVRIKALEAQVASLTKERDALRSELAALKDQGAEIAELSKSRDFWRTKYSEQCALYHDAAKERTQWQANHADVVEKKRRAEETKAAIIRDQGAEIERLRAERDAMTRHANESEQAWLSELVKSDDYARELKAEIERLRGALTRIANGDFPRPDQLKFASQMWPCAQEVALDALSPAPSPNPADSPCPDCGAVYVGRLREHRVGCTRKSPVDSLTGEAQAGHAPECWANNVSINTASCACARQAWSGIKPVEAEQPKSPADVDAFLATLPDPGPVLAVSGEQPKPAAECCPMCRGGKGFASPALSPDEDATWNVCPKCNGTGKKRGEAGQNKGDGK